MAQAEKAFENKVKYFLKQNGCWFVKTWSNGIQRSGIPDLLVCCNGHFVGVELKAPGGKPSELQLWNLVKIDDAGGFGWLLYPNGYKDFQEFIKLLKQNRPIDATKIYIEKKGWKEI